MRISSFEEEQSGEAVPTFVKKILQKHWDPALSKAPEIRSKCPFRLHVFERAPQNPPCMSVTTSEWIAAFKRHSCYTNDPENANVFMSDIETSYACNWPSYGNAQDQDFLAGGDRHACTKEQAANGEHRELPFYKNKSAGYYQQGVMLFLDHHCFAWLRDGDDRNVVLGESVHEGYSGHAIPINAGPVQSQALSGNCTEKQFKFSFMGTARKGAPVRQRLIDLFAEEAAHDVRVISSSSKTEFETIMQSSQFALAPRGDCLWSYRYQEALYFGAVPVIYADGWIPPFSDVVDPASYLVSIPEQKYDDTDSILRNIPENRYLELCKNAQDFYMRHLSSFDGMLDLTLQNLKLWSRTGKGPKQLVLF